MDMESVSNELILEFLRDFKSDVNRRFSEIDKRFEQVDKRFEQVDKRFEQITADMNLRFEQVDKRFEQVDKRFEQVDKRFEQITDEMNSRFSQVEKQIGYLKNDLTETRGVLRLDREKLDKVYEARDHVTVGFSKMLFGVNLTFSAIIATIISLGINLIMSR